MMNRQQDTEKKMHATQRKREKRAKATRKQQVCHPSNAQNNIRKKYQMYSSAHTTRNQDSRAKKQAKNNRPNAAKAVPPAQPSRNVKSQAKKPPARAASVRPSQVFVCVCPCLPSSTPSIHVPPKVARGNPNEKGIIKLVQYWSLHAPIVQRKKTCPSVVGVPYVEKGIRGVFTVHLQRNNVCLLSKSFPVIMARLTSQQVPEASIVVRFRIRSIVSARTKT